MALSQGALLHTTRHGPTTFMELSELTDKAIDYIVEGLCDEAAKDRPKLSKWETDFLISIEEQWRKNRWLSDKQKEVLGKIWDKQ